ncbi:MAG: hypothetical protein E7Z78_03450 [Methanobrevibacter thaueri]|jgi:hypothetical protein|uniref:hypothetical protein n=1 Tax=Methanobrevibacter thaueri TaxID=190975 RepID=UPI0026ED0D6F|nr:hypothetical protein [Methanobrevibacter thaueri]MBE6495481.1 hypothetical protein [Methanobrevibacter thaueri]
MISDDDALRIAQKIEDANNLDIKKTIEKAATAGYLGEEHFYCTVIEDGGMTHTVPEILGNLYKSQPLDNLYFDIISKALDHDGIYISLGYCASNLFIPDDECSEIIEYDDYDLDDDELEYLVEYALITAESVKKFRVYAEEGIAAHNKTDDVGLMVNIIDGDYKAYFALRSTDQCMSSFRVLPLGINYQKEHPLSLKNPINKILIEMIDETIVLNLSSL